MNKKDSLRFTIVLLMCMGTILVYLIHEPALGRETWMKWLFGRIFLETGEFLTPSRSPLYAVYTALFLPLGYPYGPMVTRILDSAFIFSGLFVLFRPYVGRTLSLLCALIWFPGLLELGAAVNGLSLASLFWGIALRRPPRIRANLSLSYAFFILAGMFRPNYGVVFPLVVLYDAVQLIRRRGFASISSALRPRIHDWAIVLALGVSVLFMANQSDHRWNNGWVFDAEWMGSSPRALHTAVLLGAVVQWVIIDKYDGDYENHDIYFVTKEEFGKVNSVLDIFARYDLVLGRVYSNKQIIHTITMFTDVGRMLYHGAVKLGNHKFAYPVFVSLLLIGLIGFYNSEGNKGEKMHYIEIAGAIIILTIPVLLLLPTTRYSMHVMPLFAATGLWFSRQLHDRTAILESTAPRTGHLARSVVFILPFILFSSGVSKYTNVMQKAWEPGAWKRPNLVNEVYEGHLREINSNTTECRGIMMADDNTFIPAFSEIPIQRFYSIYEIPPFGRFGDSRYSGLRPDRIDCIIVFQGTVRAGIKSSTKGRSRYVNYIVPYIDALKSMGAQIYEYDVGRGIDVVVLRRSKM